MFAYMRNSETSLLEDYVSYVSLFQHNWPLFLCPIPDLLRKVLTHLLANSLPLSDRIHVGLRPLLNIVSSALMIEPCFLSFDVITHKYRENTSIAIRRNVMLSMYWAKFETSARSTSHNASIPSKMTWFLLNFLLVCCCCKL